jgi:hypothetical protein
MALRTSHCSPTAISLYDFGEVELADSHARDAPIAVNDAADTPSFRAKSCKVENASSPFSSTTMTVSPFPSDAIRWLFMSASRSHGAAGLSAASTCCDTLAHAAEALAILGAFGADLGTFAAGVFVVRRGDEHEVRRGPAHLSARHHQPEVRRRDVLPAGLQTVIHSHAETRLVAVQADIDAAFHLFGNGHFEPPARVHSNPKQLTWFLLGVQGSEPGGTGRADNGFFRWPTRSEKPT